MEVDNEDIIDNEGSYSELDENYSDEVYGDNMVDDQLEENIDFTNSEPKPIGGIYALFNTVLNKEDSIKVGNLSKEELGNLGINVRECKRIALLAKTFGHKIFANFYNEQSKIISDSSMSKSGWFTELFVTSKRYASRESSSKVDTLPQYKKGKWKMFSKEN